ncbi:integral membrane protein GPR137 isoform X2 [Tursiops truncatus]|uniref:integral membrane protein GPR137 isoform X2 n=1 Tax=Tursiops truncatus TaxID=9739 RepID=UPI003CCF4A94
MESNLSGLVPAAGLVPALPPAVTLGLTAAYTTLYALLFFSVYAQLWLVLLYGHKRLSYQTVFLALCLLWAALRTTLFSFYFRDTPRANRLGPLPFWLLYCCPVCLQFFTLTLMNLYFAQVVFKAKAKRRPEMSRGLLAVRGAFVGASLLFLLVNVLCAVLSRRRRAQPWALLLVRVLVSDSLFVICALSLAACLCLVARRAPSTSIYLEAKGTSVCQAAAMGGAMVLLYASRACYNLAALALAPRSRLDAFDYDWYNVSDQHVRQPRLQQLVRCHRAGARLVRGQPDADHSSALLPGSGTRQPPSQSLLYPTDVIPLHLPVEHPDPSPSHPRPLCQVHLPLLARDPGGCGCLSQAGSLLLLL